MNKNKIKNKKKKKKVKVKLIMTSKQIASKILNNFTTI